MKKYLLSAILVLTAVGVGAQEVKKGDAYKDKVIDAKDVVEITKAIAGDPSTNYSKANADANEDGNVNVADVVVIVNIIHDGNTGSTTPRLIVWKANGSKVYYELNDMPETTFENGNLVIKTKNASVSYPLTEVLRYTYDGLSTKGVSEARSVNKALVKREPNTVTLANLKKGTEVQLFNSEGTLLDTKVSNGKDHVVVSVAPYPCGVYLVKYESQTLKLIKQ